MHGVGNNEKILSTVTAAAVSIGGNVTQHSEYNFACLFFTEKHTLKYTVTPGATLCCFTTRRHVFMLNSLRPLHIKHLSTDCTRLFYTEKWRITHICIGERVDTGRCGEQRPVILHEHASGVSQTIISVQSLSYAQHLGMVTNSPVNVNVIERISRNAFPTCPVTTYLWEAWLNITRKMPTVIQFNMQYRLEI